MEYTNYLTTPSGRYCQVKDITNGQYLILVKFLQSENYKKFFECLDEIAKKSIPQLDDFDIVERCYVYIAMCMYSIRGTIAINNTLIGTQEIPLTVILNNIESCYSSDYMVEYELKQGVILKFGYPKKFSFQGDCIAIDFFSGLKGYNDVLLTNQQVQMLKSKLGTRQLSFIDDELRQKLVSRCNIFQGLPLNPFEINILNEQLVNNISSFYKLSLQGFYNIMYAMIKHLRMSYSDFLKISHLQTVILMKFAAEENSKINQEAKNGNVRALDKHINDES